MGKIIYNYGVMSSAKTLMLTVKAFQFKQNGHKVVVLKPSFDTRSGKDKVESRAGLSCDAVSISKDANIIEVLKLENKLDFDILLVDESQFFTVDQVNQLVEIADNDNKFVMAYGLLTDFEGKLFDASKRLVEVADRMEELKAMCEIEECGSKATHHVRLTTQTEQCIVGDDMYKSTCRKCWYKLKQ